MRNQRGQSIVEVCLATPIVLIALYIPVDFAMMYSVSTRMQNAVREVARIAAAQDGFDKDTMEAELASRLSGYDATAVVELRTSGPTNCAQTVVATATVNYPFFFYRMMRWFGFGVSPTQAISRTAHMRYEHQPVTAGNDVMTGELIGPCTS